MLVAVVSALVPIKPSIALIEPYMVLLAAVSDAVPSKVLNPCTSVTTTVLNCSDMVAIRSLVSPLNVSRRSDNVSVSRVPMVVCN